MDRHSRPSLLGHEPATGTTRSVPLPDRLACFAPLGGPSILRGSAGGSKCSTSKAGRAASSPRSRRTRPTTRVNDGRLDRRGRLVFGTMDEGPDASPDRPDRVEFGVPRRAVWRPACGSPLDRLLPRRTPDRTSPTPRRSESGSTMTTSQRRPLGETRLVTVEGRLSRRIDGRRRRLPVDAEWAAAVVRYTPAAGSTGPAVAGVASHLLRASAARLSTGSRHDRPHRPRPVDARRRAPRRRAVRLRRRRQRPRRRALRCEALARDPAAIASDAKQAPFR